MSKINAVRLINVNYNNNAYRISDETLHFNGKSTLISLQNGGGKSVPDADCALCASKISQYQRPII